MAMKPSGGNRRHVLDRYRADRRGPDTHRANPHFNPEADQDPAHLQGAAVGRCTLEPHHRIIGEHHATFHEHGAWVEEDDETIPRVVCINDNRSSWFERLDGDAFDTIFWSQF